MAAVFSGGRPIPRGGLIANVLQLGNVHIMRSLLLFAIVFTTGCGHDWVTVTATVGSKVDASKLAQVTGKWQDPENEVVDLRLSSKGELIAGTLLWNEKAEEFSSNSVSPDVRILGENVYLFATENNETILLLVSQPDIDTIDLYLPEPAAFRRAVETGPLTGIVTETKNDHFTVALHGDNDLEHFLATKDAKLFFQNEPLLKYRRIRNQKPE